MIMYKQDEGALLNKTKLPKLHLGDVNQDITVSLFPVFDQDGAILVRLENTSEKSAQYDLQKLVDDIKKTFKAKKGYFAKIRETILTGVKELGNQLTSKTIKVRPNNIRTFKILFTKNYNVDEEK